MALQEELGRWFQAAALNLSCVVMASVALTISEVKLRILTFRSI